MLGLVVKGTIWHSGTRRIVVRVKHWRHWLHIRLIAKHLASGLNRGGSIRDQPVNIELLGLVAILLLLLGLWLGRWLLRLLLLWLLLLSK